MHCSFIKTIWVIPWLEFYSTRHLTPTFGGWELGLGLLWIELLNELSVWHNVGLLQSTSNGYMRHMHDSWRVEAGPRTSSCSPTSCVLLLCSLLNVCQSNYVNGHVLIFFLICHVNKVHCGWFSNKCYETFKCCSYSVDDLLTERTSTIGTKK